MVSAFFFFFQAEDGIRDVAVTGVQTCALPISLRRAAPSPPAGRPAHAVRRRPAAAPHLARAQRTCPRERRRRRRPSPRAGTPRNDTRARGRDLERQTRLP